jgi:hypothetical protein
MQIRIERGDDLVLEWNLADTEIAKEAVRPVAALVALLLKDTKGKKAKKKIKKAVAAVKAVPEPDDYPSYVSGRGVYPRWP